VRKDRYLKESLSYVTVSFPPRKGEKERRESRITCHPQDVDAAVEKLKRQWNHEEISNKSGK
jgi:hypothetical protein